MRGGGAAEASSVLSGELFVYDEERRLACLGPPAGSKRVAVLVGGLTDAPPPTSYAPALGAALREKGWGLALPWLSSSGPVGWALGSVEADAEELRTLARHLRESRGAKAVALVGHSTGCQDAVALLKAEPSAVDAVVLQAPVSDRESYALCPDSHPPELLALAERLVAEGNGAELLAAGPHEDVPAGLLRQPITARRYASLAGRMTAEDVFSSDLTDEELETQLGHVVVPTLVCPSLADEYVPPALHGEGGIAHAERLASAMKGPASVLPLPGANHAVDEPEAAATLVEGVVAFLEEHLP